MRGALEVSGEQFQWRGIIPACAGSTKYEYLKIANRRDHPRMCGEHASVHVERLCAGGSSPHVRGALVAETTLAGRIGIIPACAGSTTRAVRCVWRPRDHPRMCGEHSYEVCGIAFASGSSPHVRGALRPLSRLFADHGIIPACAGSTCCFDCF